MRVYVVIGQYHGTEDRDEGTVLEVFVNKQDAKKFRAQDTGYDDYQILPRELRTAWNG